MFNLGKVAEYARAVKILTLPGDDASLGDDMEKGVNDLCDLSPATAPLAPTEPDSDDNADASEPGRNDPASGYAEDFTEPPLGCAPLTGSETGDFAASFTGMRRCSGRSRQSSGFGFATTNDVNMQNIFELDCQIFAPESCHNHAKMDAPHTAFPDVTAGDLLRSGHHAEFLALQPFEMQTVANAKLLKKMLRRPKMAHVMRRAFYTAQLDAVDQYLLGSPQFSQFVKDLNLKSGKLRPTVLYDHMVKPLPEATLGSFFLILEGMAKAWSEAAAAAAAAASQVSTASVLADSGHAPLLFGLSQSSTLPIGAGSASDSSALPPLDQPPSAPPAAFVVAPPLPPPQASLQYLEDFVRGPLAQYVARCLPPWADPESQEHRRDQRLLLVMAQQRPMLRHIFEVFSQQYQAADREWSFSSPAGGGSRDSSISFDTPTRTPLLPKGAGGKARPSTASGAEGGGGGAARKSMANKDRVSIVIPKGASGGGADRRSMAQSGLGASPVMHIAQGVTLDMGFVPPSHPSYFLHGCEWRRILRLHTAVRTVVNFSIPDLLPADITRIVRASACGLPSHPYRRLIPGSQGQQQPLPAVYLTKFITPGEIFLLEPEFDDFLLRLAARLEMLHRDDVTPADAFDEAKRRVSLRKSSRFSIAPKEAPRVLIPRFETSDTPAPRAVSPTTTGDSEKPQNPFLTLWKDRRAANAGNTRTYESMVHLASRYLAVLFSSLARASVASVVMKLNFLEMRQGLLRIVPPSVIGLTLISATVRPASDDTTATSSGSGSAAGADVALSAQRPTDRHAVVSEGGGHIQVFGTGFPMDALYVLLDERVSVRCNVEPVAESLLMLNSSGGDAYVNRDGSAVLRKAQFYVPPLQTIFPTARLLRRQHPQREVVCVQDSTSTMRVGVNLRFDVPLLFSNDGRTWVDPAVQSAEDAVHRSTSFKTSDTVSFFRRLPMVMVPDDVVDQLLAVFRVYAEYENPLRTHLMSESKWGHFCACFFMLEYDVDITAIDAQTTVSQFIADALEVAAWKRQHCTEIQQHPLRSSSVSPGRTERQSAAPSSSPSPAAWISEVHIPRVSNRSIQTAFEKHATMSKRSRSNLSASSKAPSALESPFAANATLKTLSPPQFIAAVVDVVLNLCTKYADQRVELRYSRVLATLGSCWRTIGICLYMEQVRRASIAVGSSSMHLLHNPQQQPPSAATASSNGAAVRAPRPPSAASGTARVQVDSPTSLVWRVDVSGVAFRWISSEAELILRQRESIRAVRAVSRSILSHVVIHCGSIVGQIGVPESHFFAKKGEEELLRNDHLLLCLQQPAVSDRVRQIVAMNLPYIPTINRLATQDFHFFSMPLPTKAALATSSSVSSTGATRRLWHILASQSSMRIIGALCNSPGQFSTLEWVPQLGMFESQAASLTVYLPADRSNADNMAIAMLREIFISQGEVIGLLRRALEGEGFRLDPIFPPGVVDVDRD